MLMFILHNYIECIKIIYAAKLSTQLTNKLKKPLIWQPNRKCYPKSSTIPICRPKEILSLNSTKKVLRECIRNHHTNIENKLIFPLNITLKRLVLIAKNLDKKFLSSSITNCQYSIWKLKKSKETMWWPIKVIPCRRRNICPKV